MPAVHRPGGVEWEASLSGTVTVPLPGDLILGFTADVAYKDEHFTSGDLDPRGIQSAWTKVNARLGLTNEFGDWSVALVGKNLTDEVTIGISAPTVLDIGGYRATVEPYRSVSLEGKIRF